MTLNANKTVESKSVIQEPSKRSISASKRTVSGLLPAAGITLGLFLAMNAAIGIEGEPPEDSKEFEIAQITPKPFDEGTPRSGREPIKPIPSVSPPHDLPKHTIHKVPNFVPGGESIGKAPERIERTGMVQVDLGNIKMSREPTPIGRLNVAFPPEMAAKGIEGACEVSFDLTPQGEAFNIRPKCTHSGFERSARRAVSKARFAPRVERGVPIAQEGMIYPIEYRLADD